MFCSERAKRKEEEDLLCLRCGGHVLGVVAEEAHAHTYREREREREGERERERERGNGCVQCKHNEREEEIDEREIQVCEKCERRRRKQQEEESGCL